MAKMDMVSVILPTYNRSGYIRDAIMSVLDQTYGGVELIIVDDGSTDGTEEAVKPFLTDKRVKYILQKNSGAAAARNHGLKLSTGKYVAFIDSDDIWKKDKLSVQVGVMHAAPQVGVVCSDFSAIKNGELVEESHIRSYFSVLDTYRLSYDDVFDAVLSEKVEGLEETDKVYYGNIYYTMLFGNIILTSTTLFRSEIFDYVPEFDTGYATLEDYDFFLKVTKKYDLALIDKQLIYYRYSENQLSGDMFFGVLAANLIDIFKKNLASTGNQDFLRANRKKIRQRLGMYQAQHAYYYFAHEEMSLAAKCYLRSIVNRPTCFSSYPYLVFSLLPVGVTRFMRRLKSFNSQH